MDFLFRKGLALIGNRDNPDEQKRLFDRFGGGEKLKSLYLKMKSALENHHLDAPDPFDTSFPDPNMIAGYLDEPSEKSEFQRRYENACLDSEPLLSEAAAVSLILQKFQNESTKAPKSCRQQAYAVGESEQIAAESEPKRKENPKSRAGHYRYSGDSSESYSELGSFDAGSQETSVSVSKPISAKTADFRSKSKEKNFKNRRAESVRVMGNEEGKPKRKRTRVFPFLLAAAATALLFHYQPFTGVMKRYEREQKTTFQTTDSIPAFSEAPVSEKIATPSRSGAQPAEDMALSVSAADSGWKDITLLSESEQIQTENAVLLYRPFRRGIRGDVVTAIPGQ